MVRVEKFWYCTGFGTSLQLQFPLLIFKIDFGGVDTKVDVNGCCVRRIGGAGGVAMASIGNSAFVSTAAPEKMATVYILHYTHAP